MRPLHCRHVYRLSIVILLSSAVSLIVPEAVLDPDNDPGYQRQIRSWNYAS